jgi:hypothetical protein
VLDKVFFSLILQLPSRASSFFYRRLKFINLFFTVCETTTTKNDDEEEEERENGGETFHSHPLTKHSPVLVISRVGKTARKQISIVGARQRRSYING